MDYRFFQGHTTRQVDGHTGRPADPESWYAEPTDYEGDTLYSPAFPTRAHAEAWADAQPDDEDE